MYLRKVRLLKSKNLHRGPKNDKYAYKGKLQTRESTGYIEYGEWSEYWV